MPSRANELVGKKFLTLNGCHIFKEQSVNNADQVFVSRGMGQGVSVRMSKCCASRDALCVHRMLKWK